MKTSSHALSWAAFAAMLLFAAGFVIVTSSGLPARVAVHFDAAGQATSYMTVGRYRMAVLAFAVAFPGLLVAGLKSAYSRAKTFNLPNRDYWLAPQRIADTRSFLVAHGVWFGTLLAGLMCFMHRLLLEANRQIPPTLSNQAFFVGLLAFTVCMAVWLGAMLLRFRRP